MAEWAVWYESGERGGEAIMTAFTQSVCLLLPLAAACLRAAFSCTLYNSMDRSNNRSDLNQSLPKEQYNADHTSALRTVKVGVERIAGLCK